MPVIAIRSLRPPRPQLPARPAAVRRRERREWPPFSSMPLLLLIGLKPFSDAFYETEAVKYLYMALLLCFVVFARWGARLSGVRPGVPAR